MIAQFFFLLQIVAPVFVVMALGYLMRKIGILSSEADRSLTRLVVTLLAPSLAFDAIIGNDALAKPENWILPPVLGFGSIVLGIAVSRWGAKLFRVPEGDSRRTFVFTTSLHNYGYIPLLLCHALFDRDTMGVPLHVYTSASNWLSGASRSRSSQATPSGEAGARRSILRSSQSLPRFF